MDSDWVLGFQDEVWFSRLAQPNLHAWTTHQPLRLVQKEADKKDTDPKALACYGLFRADTRQMYLRFVAGRPVSHVTTAFLSFALSGLSAEGKRVLVMVWDNASWHISKEVRTWIRAYNRCAKREGGCRLLVCRLPSKSPWLNAIEPKWVHGKRAIVEPERKLSASELKERLCEFYQCEMLPPITQDVT